jgi:hypothetical protein
MNRMDLPTPTSRKSYRKPSGNTELDDLTMDSNHPNWIYKLYGEILKRHKAQESPSDHWKACRDVLFVASWLGSTELGWLLI